MKLLGTLHQLDDSRGAVRVEDVYDTDIDDLWEACTDPERLARWIAEVSGDLRAGGTFTGSSPAGSRVRAGSRCASAPRAWC